MEIIWRDENGQKFVIDEYGEKIFILQDGSRISETDLILEELTKQFEEEQELEKIEEERQFYEELDEELEQRQKEEDDEDYEAADQYWNGIGMYSKDWYEGED